MLESSTHDDYLEECVEVRRRVIVFARAPELGVVKTRLAADLGADAALAIYRSLAEHTLAVARGVSECEIEVRYTPAEGADIVARWLGADLLLRPQDAGDLGLRMHQAVSEALQHGVAAVVVIGTDCPSLGAPVIERAFDWLASADVVLGPASDGGYYLIALSAPHRALFEGIPWSSPETLQRTLAIAHESGLRVALLEERSDVDTGEDWRKWLSRSHRIDDTTA